MGDGQVFHIKDSLNTYLEIGVKDWQFGAACQELDKLVQLFLIVVL